VRNETADTSPLTIDRFLWYRRNTGQGNRISRDNL
jgi:hypothetical protein